MWLTQPIEKPRIISKYTNWIWYEAFRKYIENGVMLLERNQPPILCTLLLWYGKSFKFDFFYYNIILEGLFLRI